MHLVCPTCRTDRHAEFYRSERSGSGFQVYCRRCEEGCVDAVDVEKSAPATQLEIDSIIHRTAKRGGWNK